MYSNLAAQKRRLVIAAFALSRPADRRPCEHVVFPRKLVPDCVSHPRAVGLRVKRRPAEFKAQERLAQLPFIEKADRAAARKAHGGRCAVKFRERVQAVRAHRGLYRQELAADDAFRRVEQIKKPGKNAHALPSNRSLRPE